jgi:bifunctional enzyme CysN/CysC
MAGANVDKDQEAKIVIVGHVDHGKSTLLGRILLDCGQLPEDKIAHVQKICDDKGIGLEPAFFLDALQEEQEQGISIDTTRVRFQFNGQRFLLIDAPGHIEFLKNMTTGASEAEVGILVIDCLEGIRAQTTRHLKILSVLGVNRVIVAVNKLDKIQYDQQKFEQIAQEITEQIEKEYLQCLAVIPISALKGENIQSVSDNFSWYFGQALLPFIYEHMSTPVANNDHASTPLRMVLQDVYRFDDRRHFAGRVIAGQIKPGDDISFLPSGKVATVASIEQFPNIKLDKAVPGDSIALCLTDQIFVERGEIISHVDQTPEVDNEIQARIVWLSATQDFNPQAEYIVKLGTNEATCQINPVAGSISGNALSANKMSDDLAISNGTFADVTITATKPLAFDRLASKNSINKLVICSPYETVACGVLSAEAVRSPRQFASNPNIRLESGYLSRTQYEQTNSHAGSVLWITGLSGSGKSTLAKNLEQKLFAEKSRVVVLDGDNLRKGINADLGFTPEDRSENIRRIAHIAKLFLDTGFIVIVAAISPYAQDRQMAKEIIGANDFHEIFVFCPLEVCQQRDPKGLYAKAKDGSLKSMTGHAVPYQPPQNPALRLDSSSMTIDEEVGAVLKLIENKRQDTIYSGTEKSAELIKSSS